MTLVLENQIELACEYDADDDTLYAWVGERPSAAITYETDEGHLVRLDPATGEFVGVTVFEFNERWADTPIALHWEVEVERVVPWLPFFPRKRKERVAGQRVLHRVSNVLA